MSQFALNRDLRIRQSTIYKVMQLLPVWLVDNMLFRKFACWLVKPKQS
jgi:hypothetical protein